MKLRVCSADSSAAASGGKPGRVDERVVTAFDLRAQLARSVGSSALWCSRCATPERDVAGLVDPRQPGDLAGDRVDARTREGAGAVHLGRRRGDHVGDHGGQIF
jgi:hypothetical protein